MFLRRSLASLARAYKLHIHYFFSLGTLRVLPPPPPAPIPKSWLRYCTGESPPTPSHWCPIYILNNRNGSPTPCTEIIFIWRLFGARVYVNFNLIMHTKNLYFGTQISQKSPPWEGDTPPTPSPLVSNTLYFTTLQQKRFPHQIIYLWSLELELMLI